jgi:zinc D-Ala-D-Ala carboxypeptidase
VQLSRSFHLEEFLASQTATRLERPIIATPEQIQNVARLCVGLLQPIRDQLGRAIIITSGIRPAWLNTAVGGAPNSAHLTGRAADIRVVGMSATMFCRWVKRRGFVPDKCIEEFGSWTHLQIARPGDKPRGQFLQARKVGGRTIYTELDMGI